MNEFLTDVATVNREIGEELRREPEDQRSNPERTVAILNRALALNMVCVLRHMRHFVAAERFDARTVANEFLEHTVRESEHSDRIVGSIHRLGGEPVLERESVKNRGHLACDSLMEFEQIVREDLAAENEAIAAYTEMINGLAEFDPASTQLIKQILSLEEEHVEVMLNFVVAVVE
jgi:bacterioferritin